MTLALWVIALAEVTQALACVYALRSKGKLRPIKFLRKREQVKTRQMRVTERP